MKIGNFNLLNNGTYIIAELSANHNGNLQNALDSIKAAKDLGANAIKIQTYTADTLTLKSNNDDFIVKGGTIWDGITLQQNISTKYSERKSFLDLLFFRFP